MSDREHVHRIKFVDETIDEPPVQMYQCKTCPATFTRVAEVGPDGRYR